MSALEPRQPDDVRARAIEAERIVAAVGPREGMTPREYRKAQKQAQRDYRRLVKAEHVARRSKLFLINGPRIFAALVCLPSAAMGAHLWETVMRWHHLTPLIDWKVDMVLGFAALMMAAPLLVFVPR